MNKRVLMMPDKVIRSGNAPVYNGNGQTIATINYYYVSLTHRIEILDNEGRIMATGNSKIFSFRQTWLIYRPNGEEMGNIKKLFTLFSHNYIYTNQSGATYQIEGSLMARNFSIYRDGELAVQVTGSQEFFTFHPHNFEVIIYDETLDTYEVISIIEGIRSLVELESHGSSNSSH